MEKLQGVLTGDAVPVILAAAQTGSVLGLFHKGCYVQWGERVLLVCDSAYGRIPFGIGINGYETVFPYCKDWEGKSVVLQKDCLLFPDVQVGIRYSQASATSAPYAIEPMNREAMLLESLLCENGTGFLRLLAPDRETLCSGTMPEGCGGSDLYAVRAAEKLQAFFQAMNSGDSMLLGNALEKMQGFGQGLTPSMDDWLTGFLYVFGRRGSAAGARLLQEEAVREISRRTNRISAEYTICAAEKYCFAALEDVLRSPCCETAENLLRIGHSSGSDLLTGMLFAAQYVSNDHEITGK